MFDFTSFVKRIGHRIPDATYRREIEDEILDHLKAAALELHTRGLSLEDARERAMQQFGDPDEIGKELGRVHNVIKFRYFAVGGLLWHVAGAILFESHAFRMTQNWLAQLPFQLLGLPHWLALQSPQIRNLTILDPLARFMSDSYSISPWHFDAAIGAVILTVAVYGVYRLGRALQLPEARQAWSLLSVAFRR